MTKRRTARALRERKAAPTACAARFAPRRAQTSPFAGKPNQTQAPQPPINRMNKFALGNPVKVITRSTDKVITDSRVSDHVPERSDAGVGL